MCGLVGVYNFKTSADSEKAFIDDALLKMHHRGPDSKDVWQYQNYITGFTRLAIRDLSKQADQPMVSDDNNFSLSFNGEIYNSDIIRKELQSFGVNFRTTSDTEVLLQSLIKWDEGTVLSRLDGMFAFAFFDSRKSRLVLARDRAGIKPLYIGISHQGVVFSSQYDHVIQHRYIRDNPINQSALGAYLSLGYVPEKSGMIIDTWLIPHGYYCVISSTEIKTEPYYQYPLSTSVAVPFSLEDTLRSNVNRQLVSDVPVGTFLSGGVDSPLISFLASRQKNIASFTIGLANKKYDESEAAEKYAAIFDTKHHCKHISEQDLLNSIDDNTKAFSEPFADFSSIPTLILSKFAKENVTVALSGDGADELFWGYPRSVRMIKEGPAVNQVISTRILKLAGQKLFSRERVFRKRHLQVDDFPSYYYRSLFITGAERWMPKVFRGEIGSAYFFNRVKNQSSFNYHDVNEIMNIVRKMEYDIHLQRILLKVDRASMYHSLEVRVPFLCNDIIEYSSQLSYADCIIGDAGKCNLKKMLAAVTKPEMVYQPKRGFTIPLGEWIRGALKNEIRDRLHQMPTELKYYFDIKQIDKLLNEHNSGTKDWNWFIWALFSLVNWHTCHRKQG